nr:hypothetical protein [Veillonella sp.]
MKYTNSAPSLYVASAVPPTSACPQNRRTASSTIITPATTGASMAAATPKTYGAQILKI